VEILCACGCGELFEKKHNSEKIKPEHRREHRLKVERERQRRYTQEGRQELYKLRKSQGVTQAQAIKKKMVLVSCLCPKCRKQHKVAFTAPQRITTRIYCHDCARNRDEIGDATILMWW